MSEWQRIRLGDYAETFAGGTPDRGNAAFFGGSIPWVKSTEVNLGRIRKTEEFLTDDGFHFSAAKWIPARTVLVALYGATAAQIAYLEIAATANQAVLAVIPDEHIDSIFLFYALTAIKEKILFQAQGSGQPNLNKQIIDRVTVDLPPLFEQRRIAEILSTLDEAIEQTEALIAKHQQIKAGLMHDLFTRGVTPDGHLRPTREQAPDLYKESPLGWIPKEWDCRPCSQICERITVGIVIRPTQYYVKHGVPAFRSANVRETGIDPSDFVFISQEANNLLAKSQVRAGDILTVRTGYPGTSAVVPDEFSGANAIDILLSRPTSEVNSFFLCYWINSSFGKGHVLRTQGGLAQQHFNVGELRDLLVALPKPDEQRAITERLDSMSQHIRCEESVLAKWMKQKHGLMHDLLTGRVRAPVAETEKGGTS